MEVEIRVQPVSPWRIIGGLRQSLWRFGEGSTVHISALEDENPVPPPVPGTPVADYFTDIATRLKEIEADRHRDIQAVEIPEEKTS